MLVQSQQIDAVRCYGRRACRQPVTAAIETDDAKVGGKRGGLQIPLIEIERPAVYENHGRTAARIPIPEPSPIPIEITVRRYRHELKPPIFV
jgi:hypothetical protein